ncbi:MAG TPA: YlmC/YmxH family sporulation protein [Firmicutes bacterium]|nr:YlmC/YmxH family sporulation protein [Bacillota bacterium]
MRISELRGKEVINLTDGARLGIIGECDLVFDPQSGKIMSILLPNKGGMLMIFGEGKPLNIPWHTLKRIGDEVLIVELDGAAERQARLMYGK